MFDYDRAYSRNIGWLTIQEQTILRSKKVAIAGLGGVGGEHLVSLARLGIEQFAISDFDEFDVHNINRQAGALMSTMGQSKSSVLEAMIKDINPESQVEVFAEGVNDKNVDAFLDGVDIYVDSLDFFALEARCLVFKRCYELNIPVITVAPLGFGAAMLCFLPDKMTFEEYFRFNDKHSEKDKLIQFLIGLSPSMLQKDYLVDPSTADFNEKKGPSTIAAVKLCSGVAVSNVTKILLGRGDVVHAPRGLHFDAYKNRLKETWIPWGNRNPVQKLKFSIAKAIVLK